MPANVIMPALELAQETGKLLRWIKAPGDMVRKGEPIAEIETDKVTVELEAPASGILQDVTAQEGDVVPVGHTIAIIADSASPNLSPQGGRSGTLAPQGSGLRPDLLAQPPCRWQITGVQSAAQRRQPWLGKDDEVAAFGIERH